MIGYITSGLILYNGLLNDFYRINNRAFKKIGDDTLQHSAFWPGLLSLTILFAFEMQF